MDNLKTAITSKDAENRLRREGSGVVFQQTLGDGMRPVYGDLHDRALARMGSMAKKQITLIVDDLTGEEAADAKTVAFSLEGVSYEVDLTPANADKLSEALAPYIAAGRRIGGRSRSTRSGGGSDASKIREWAASQGLEVPTRGRIPAAIVEQYEASR